MAMEPSGRSASVQIGAYSIDVASGSGSFVQFESEHERENATALEAALKEEQKERSEPDERPMAVAAIEEFQESADAVTGRIEQADNLLQAAARGQLLELSNLTGEIDSLLDLFGRLDRAGRFEEELRLMRSLNGLLALALRWLDLIRSLRSLLRSAERAGHAAGEAFAHHELGSLSLCADRPEQALEHLQQASLLEERAGIPLGGRCATRHNLDSARRDLELKAASGIQPPRRLQRLVLLAGAIAVAGAGGAGIALAIHGRGGHQSTTAPPPSARKVFVRLAGSGAGSVRGSGLACPSDCSTLIENGGTITLTATPAVGSVFTSWSGVDCGSGRSCRVTVDRGLTVTATFAPANPAQPLRAPTSLRAEVVSANEVDLSWLQPTSNVAVVGYVIYRDQQKLATVAGTETVYRDTSVAPSASYVYSVQALAAHDKASPLSGSASATTPALADAQPPTAPTDLKATVQSSSEIDLTWTEATDNVGVSGYVIYRDGVELATVAGTVTNYPDTGLTAGTSYSYTVRAIDAAANTSPESNQVAATTPKSYGLR